MGIIGILVYPNIKLKRKRVNRRAPVPFRGKRAENCLHNVGKSLGEGLAHEILRRPYVTSNDLGGYTYFIKKMCLHNVNIHINFYQNRSINECARKKKAKIP